MPEVKRCSSRRCGISRRPCSNFFTGAHRRPTWRKAGVHEGFRQVGFRPHHVERLNRRFGRVWVPKVGWVRFRLSRPVPEGVKSYRVTRDRAGRWHIAFAHIPDPMRSGRWQRGRHRPRRGRVRGAVDRRTAARPGLTAGESKRLKVLQRRLARPSLAPSARPDETGGREAESPRGGPA